MEHSRNTWCKTAGKIPPNSGMSTIAQTPEPPYYAVTFTSLRSDFTEGYEHTAERMLELAARWMVFSVSKACAVRTV